MSVIEELVTRPTAALRARLPGARRWAVCGCALALVLAAGVLVGRALAPQTQLQPDPLPDVAQQPQARILATLERARAGGRAELRRARTPKGQEQAAWRLARAHGDAAAALRGWPGEGALSGSLVLAQAAYAELARAFRARAAERFAAARRGVERAEAGLAGALGTATAPAQPPAVPRAAARSGTPLALLVLVLGLGSAGLLLRPAQPRRRVHAAAAGRKRSMATPRTRLAATRRRPSPATPRPQTPATPRPRTAAPPRPRAPATAAPPRPQTPATAAPPRPQTPRPQAPATAAPPRPATAAAQGTGWTCEITWTASLRRAGFHAVAATPGRQPVIIARSANLASAPFLPPIPDGEALAAARALAHRLLAAGWAPTTRALHWYSQRFEWPGDDEPDPLLGD